MSNERWWAPRVRLRDEYFEEEEPQQSSSEIIREIAQARGQAVPLPWNHTLPEGEGGESPFLVTRRAVYEAEILERVKEDT
jgi:hypothetical protein